MSDLSSASRVDQGSVQLSVDWYFDPAVFEAEKRVLFDNGPGYVGHELMVPAAGDYHTLAWMDHGKMLVRSAKGIELLSNVCRHRQGIMLQGRGNVQSIVCPLHRWTYGLDGRLLGAPHFPTQPCLDLHKSELQSWNGLLFAGRRNVREDLAGFSLAGEFDFSNYVFDKVVIQDYPCNWKTFLEVYVELYHVEPFHPGLARFVDCDNFSWEFGNTWSNQMLGVNDNLRTYGTPAYRRYQELLLEYRNGQPPKFGTLWFVYYPNVMVEWYPEALIISTVVPRSPTLTTNVVEFFYPEEVAYFEPEVKQAHQAAYLETGVEDGDLCERMDRGRRVLYDQGLNDAGPYQSPMEDGMQHFHEYLRREVEPQIRR